MIVNLMKFAQTGGVCLELSSTFCAQPFYSIQVSSTADYFICCHTALKTPQGTLFSAIEMSVDDYWNHPELVKMRNLFLMGKWPEQCQKCRRDEACGQKSQRQSHNEIFLSDSRLSLLIDEAIKNKGRLPHLGPVLWGIRFGNICNLRCRMCNEFDSSSIGDEIEKITKKSLNIAVKQCWDVKMFNSWLDKYTKNIGHVQLMGGEPMLMDSVAEFLSYLIARKYCVTTELALTTNLTVISKDVYEMVKNFKHSHITFSIDGTKKTQEYIRYPSRWEGIEQNLGEVLREYVAPNVTFEFFPTFQTLNLLNLPALFKFFQKYPNVKHCFFNVVNQDNGLNYRYIPNHLREEVIKLYQNEITDNQLTEHFAGILQRIVEQLNCSKHDAVLFSESIEKLKKQDQFRGIKAGDYLPIFCELIAKDGYYF